MLILRRKSQEAFSIFDRRTGEKIGEIMNLGPDTTKLGITLPDEWHVLRNELPPPDVSDDAPSEAA